MATGASTSSDWTTSSDSELGSYRSSRSGLCVVTRTWVFAAASRKAGFKDYLILARTPSYVLDCVGMAMMTFAMGGIAAWMPDYVLSQSVKQQNLDGVLTFTREDLANYIGTAVESLVRQLKKLKDEKHKEHPCRHCACRNATDVC